MDASSLKLYTKHAIEHLVILNMEHTVNCFSQESIKFRCNCPCSTHKLKKAQASVKALTEQQHVSDYLWPEIITLHNRIRSWCTPRKPL